MEITLKNAQVLKVYSRTSEADATTGETTTFVTFVVLDGVETRYLWAFANDFATVPAVGDVVDFTVYVSAKVNPDNPKRPRLTLRAKSYSAA